MTASAPRPDPRPDPRGLTPTLHHVDCPERDDQGQVVGSHRMAYWLWCADEAQAQADHVIVCVHGLTRQGRDFDALARHILGESTKPLRIVCPDVAGRGQSDWLANPAGYQVPTYAADMLALLHQLHTQAPLSTLDWVGTSMGGLIGMALAGSPNLPLPTPIRRLVLNDVGPKLQWPALDRIRHYVGQTGRFAHLDEALAHLRQLFSAFGPHSDSEWKALNEAMVKRQPDGSLCLHYDPRLGQAFGALTPELAEAAEPLAWTLYEAITARTLLLRGQDSDLLSAETASRMARSGPGATLVNFAGVGHAPTLVAPEQRQVVSDFLLG